MVNNAHADALRSPYRAPELLFGPNDYDPRALDLWGAGATLAEFFRQTGPYPVEVDSGPDSSDEELTTAVAALKIGRRPSPTDNERTPLFNAAYGDLGLAASIFRLLGTPTKDSWPVSGFELVATAQGTEVGCRLLLLSLLGWLGARGPASFGG